MRPAFRKALLFVGVPLALAVLYVYWPTSSEAVSVSADSGSVETAEFRLARLRQVAATVSAKQEVLKKVSADLAKRETGLLRADTGAQAQAQVIQIVRRLASEEAPPIEIRSTELAALTPLGDSYGSAVVSVQVECQIAQLVNFLAAIASQEELISTQDLQISAGNPKEKTVRVRLTVSGVIPQQLLPESATKGKDKDGAKAKAGKAGGSR